MCGAEFKRRANLVVHNRRTGFASRSNTDGRLFPSIPGFVPSHAGNADDARTVKGRRRSGVGGDRNSTVSRPAKAVASIEADAPVKSSP